ncbi:MAG: hypothetical protein SGPRY_001603, partial [Prymnesium sp.]
MEALRTNQPERARLMIDEAQQLYLDRDELTEEKEELLRMIRVRVNEAQGAVVRSLQEKAIASKLAAKLGPVAWSPSTGSAEEEAAMREGDAAVSDVVRFLGEKDFAAAYDALEAARDAFRRAGSDVEEARAQTLDNLYGYIRAETERNAKLQKLISAPRTAFALVFDHVPFFQLVM